MATDVSSQTEPSMTRLVSGIIDDAQQLFKHQAELLKHDIRKDLNEAKEASLSIGVGAVLLGVGAVLLSFMLVHLLSWAVPAIPLWGGFGIVGGVLAVVGGVVFYRGEEKLEHLNPLPEESAEGLKENLQWKTNRT